MHLLPVTASLLVWRLLKLAFWAYVVDVASFEHLVQQRVLPLRVVLWLWWGAAWSPAPLLVEEGKRWIQVVQTRAEAVDVELAVEQK